MSICTSEGWYVSCTYPPGRLSVSRYPLWHRDHTYTHAVRGDHDGRIFGVADYTQFCLERGYLQKHIDVERSMFKATHKFTGRLFMRLARVAIMRAKTYRELLGIAEEFKSQMNEMGAPGFTGIAYSNGIMTCARRLRPDLVIMR